MLGLLERSWPWTDSRRSGRGRRWLALAALVAVAVLGGTAVVRGLDLLPDNPFAQETVDRTGPALMLALKDLADYHGAQGSFQVVVDVEKDTQGLPSLISGERTTYLANGTVDGIVDFSSLGDNSITLSDDGTRATISLPRPRLGPAVLDLANSRVLARDRGLLDRVGGAFVDNPTSERALNIAAQDKLSAAAADSDLLRRTEDNTRSMLTGLAQSFGVDEVEVRFDADGGV